MGPWLACQVGEIRPRARTGITAPGAAPEQPSYFMQLLVRIETEFWISGIAPYGEEMVSCWRGACTCPSLSSAKGQQHPLSPMHRQALLAFLDEEVDIGNGKKVGQQEPRGRESPAPHMQRILFFRHCGTDHARR